MTAHETGLEWLRRQGVSEDSLTATTARQDQAVSWIIEHLHYVPALDTRIPATDEQRAHAVNYLNIETAHLLGLRIGESSPAGDVIHQLMHMLYTQLRRAAERDA